MSSSNLQLHQGQATMSPDRHKIKEKILASAQTRFIRYGFKKTNVTEIADDCDMSPANLYRFFENKEEIGEAVVEKYMGHIQRIILQVLASNASPVEKMSAFVRNILSYNYSIFTNQLHLYELIEFISAKRRELPLRHIQLKKDCLIEILAQAQAAGLIRSGSVTRQAELSFQALQMFLLPHSLIQGAPPLDKLLSDANELIVILFIGLKGERG